MKRKYISPVINREEVELEDTLATGSQIVVGPNDEDGNIKVDDWGMEEQLIMIGSCLLLISHLTSIITICFISS